MQVRLLFTTDRIQDHDFHLSEHDTVDLSSAASIVRHQAFFRVETLDSDGVM